MEEDNPKSEHCFQIRTYIDSHPDLSPLVLLGPPGSGRSTLLSSALQDFKKLNPERSLHPVTVDLIECFSDSILLRTLKSKLCRITNLDTSDINSWEDFISSLSSWCKSHPNETFCFIFDRAEKLCEKFSQSTVELLFNLPAFLEGYRVRVIFDSSMLHFSTPSGSLDEPKRLYFLPYSKQETRSILLKKFMADLDDQRNSNNQDKNLPSLYQDFLKVFLDVLYENSCKNIKELIKLASVIFPVYVRLSGANESVVPRTEQREEKEGGSKLTTNPQQLSYLKRYSLLKDYLDCALQGTTYLDDIEAQVEKLRKGRGADSKTRLDSVEEYCLGDRLLIVSAFLASNNPPETDEQMFTLESGKKGKGGKGMKRAKGSYGNIEPENRIFLLERLAAIYEYLDLDENQVDESKRRSKPAFDLSQVTKLSKLGLLCSIGPYQNINEAKYRSSLNYGLVQVIAESIGVNLNSLMYK